MSSIFDGFIDEIMISIIICITVSALVFLDELNVWIDFDGIGYRIHQGMFFKY